MSTTRPFAYNPSQIPIIGTIQFGDIAIGVDQINYSLSPGGLEWWNGPDEDLGYVIAIPVPSDSQPTNVPGVSASIGFFRSGDLTDQSFIEITNYIAGQTFTNITQAKTYLDNNGYWSNFILPTPTPTPTITPTPTPIVTSGLILNYDISNLSSYPGSGSTITDLTGSSNSTLFNTPTYTSSGGGYLTFNGSNQYFVTNTALGSKLNPPNTSTIISIFVWVFPMDNGVIVQEIGQPQPNAGWHDSQIEMVSGTLRFSVWQNQPGFVSTIPTPLNNWYYVGFTYNGTNLIGYVNGVSAVTSGTISRLTPGANLYYTIAHADATNLGDGSFSNMRFGGMQIYNTALSPSNVLLNFNSQKSRFGL